VDVLRAAEAGACDQDRADRPALNGRALLRRRHATHPTGNRYQRIVNPHKQTLYRDWLSFLLTCC